MQQTAATGNSSDEQATRGHTTAIFTTVINLSDVSKRKTIIVMMMIHAQHVITH